MAALVAGGLLAAACGSSGASDDPGVNAATGSGAGSVADADASSSGPPAPSTAEVARPAPTVEEHFFPDLTTVNVADGSTINLADQLAGGDTPVLLWFWAPH